MFVSNEWIFNKQRIYSDSFSERIQQKGFFFKTITSKGGTINKGIVDAFDGRIK